jgi:uncharacterized lipoprotein YddW (UPF0748 family)
MFSSLLVAAGMVSAPFEVPPPQVPVLAPRFQSVAPFPGLPSVKVDSYNAGIGIAQQFALNNQAQARIMWVDASANLDRYNTEEKIIDLVTKIRKAGFNTLVFDVKPISGYVNYPSKYAPKMTEWFWGKAQLPKDFDPVAIVTREAQKHGLSLFIHLNAFTEGHFGARVGPVDGVPTAIGPGLDKPDWQTVNYDPVPVLRAERAPDQTVVLRLPGRDEPGEANIARWADIRPNIPQDVGAFVLVTPSGNLFPYRANETPEVPPGGARYVIWSGNLEALKKLGSHSRWRLDTEARFVRIAEKPNQLPLITNPFNPDVNEYMLNIAREVLTNYEFDGLIYDDRLRFGGMSADFSAMTRAAFEKHVGRELAWPNDVFEYTITPQLTLGVRPGPYFDSWLAWRAMRLRDFVRSVRQVIEETRPSVLLGVYAGSWYGEYSNFSTNYASDQFQAGFRYLTPAYQMAGFASDLDVFISGCYYRVPTIFRAMELGLPVGQTVEAGAQLANRAVRDACWHYAGIMVIDYQGSQKALAEALQAAAANSQGVMVFDYSHNIDQVWPVFERAFRQPARAPHQIPGLLDRIRERRAEYDRLRMSEPPTIIDAGRSGVGL